MKHRTTRYHRPEINNQSPGVASPPLVIHVFWCVRLMSLMQTLLQSRSRHILIYRSLLHFPGKQSGSLMRVTIWKAVMTRGCTSATPVRQVAYRVVGNQERLMQKPRRCGVCCGVGSPPKISRCMMNPSRQTNQHGVSCFLKPRCCRPHLLRSQARRTPTNGLAVRFTSSAGLVSVQEAHLY